MKQYYTDNGTEKTINTYYPAYDSYGNILTKQIEKEDGTRIQENYEYSATYNHAYLTKKYSTVTDYTGSPEIVQENYTYNLYTGRLFTANNNGHETKYYYDELGRQTKIINPDLFEKNISYNDTTNTATITLENNFQARNLYDGLGRLVKKQEIKEGQ
ncbi:hypothetical protein [Candidatus Formimonas warabiya]|uniref:RHS repeat protein n=1 Tax=Formimonas warabiya TaxID=1761012 RepID=A0A3G1KWU7_FORW1|nr:hypothetical protein [Candidatus Formimonas warabiya]ATW26926.1 hypothetical protein DCMF_21135 [Candidatus Formimonas warabiya]